MFSIKHDVDKTQHRVATKAQQVEKDIKSSLAAFKAAYAKLSDEQKAEVNKISDKWDMNQKRNIGWSTSNLDKQVEAALKHLNDAHQAHIASNIR